MNSAEIEIQNQLKCADGPATSVYWFSLPLCLSLPPSLPTPVFLDRVLSSFGPRILTPPASASHRLGSQACITMLGPSGPHFSVFPVAVFWKTVAVELELVFQ